MFRISFKNWRRPTAERKLCPVARCKLRLLFPFLVCKTSVLSHILFFFACQPRKPGINMNSTLCHVEDTSKYTHQPVEMGLEPKDGYFGIMECDILRKTKGLRFLFVLIFLPKLSKSVFVSSWCQRVLWLWDCAPGLYSTDPHVHMNHVFHAPLVTWPEPGRGTAIHLGHLSALTVVAILELSNGHR